MLNAPPTKPTEELRKLAIYMVRQFVASAEKNPKIYAELFFWKTIRECNEMENNYEAQTDGANKAWSESQEDELRRLFQENQENPENDQGKISSVSCNDYCSFFVDVEWSCPEAEEEDEEVIPSFRLRSFLFSLLR